MKYKWTVGIFSTVLVFCFSLLVFSWQDTPSIGGLPLSGKVILIDPGHGGPDGGAVNRDATIIEKDIALQMSFKIRDYLQEAGALVLMTRHEDKDLAEDVRGYSKRKTADLKKRLSIIHQSEADLLLSVHMNAIPSAKWNGAQTFYFPLQENERLAIAIQEEIRDQLQNTQRLAKPINHVFLLKHAEMPSALLEAGFLSNPAEAQLLSQDSYQEKMAAAIYRGILRFFYEGETPNPESSNAQGRIEPSVYDILETEA
ncbi:N-acetylmuramoyl-L-alanine amidase CwlD [Aureibacillus halotolerans]|uniref:N-acetylmuramoyl-L-alanine amidase n=1 Tax=Aureibacillus halotolerans TaxID=1508390 RepID=A0A4R6TQF6_9BACI|nr:N-acetylmuramoyl-L-alanine amidase CwlD [Aureibacillus halotolerans]TDQ34747.1 N-acetylmuramoyl-L-alanine amidase [Aureibacillus halotolerans]